MKPLLVGVPASHQAFSSVFNPLQRVVEFPSQSRKDNLFGEELPLEAKPSSDVRFDHPDGIFVDI